MADLKTLAEFGSHRKYLQQLALANFLKIYLLANKWDLLKSCNSTIQFLFI